MWINKNLKIFEGIFGHRYWR